MNNWDLPIFLCLDDIVSFYCDVDSSIRLRETLWDIKKTTRIKKGFTDFYDSDEISTRLILKVSYFKKIYICQVKLGSKNKH